MGDQNCRSWLAEEVAEKAIEDLKDLIVNNASLTKRELLEKMKMAEAKIDSANKQMMDLSD